MAKTRTTPRHNLPAAIVAAKAAQAAVLDAEYAATAATDEATKAAALLVELENQVRAGDTTVTFDQIERQRQLARFAELNADGAHRRNDKATTARDSAAQASAIAWHSVILSEMGAYRATATEALDALATDVAALVGRCWSKLADEAARFDAVLADAQGSLVPATVTPSGDVQTAIWDVGVQRSATLGSIGDLRAPDAISKHLDLAFAMAKLVVAAGPHIDGTDSYRAMITAVSRNGATMATFAGTDHVTRDGFRLPSTTDFDEISAERWGALRDAAQAGLHPEPSRVPAEA